MRHIGSKTVAMVALIIFVMICFLIALSVIPAYGSVVTDATLTPSAWLYLPYISKQRPPEPITPGVLTFHQADEAIAYNWFTYVPATINKSEVSYIWVSGLHGNLVTDDYSLITEESRNQAQWRMPLADQHHYILLVPVIPRPDYVYVVAFAWKVFLNTTDPFFQRPDQKVNMMIDRFTDDLRHAGYNVHDRVFIDGFSAGAMFAQRYALLHPERIQALAAGQCGGAMTLPQDQYETTQMEWPVGTSDFSSLIGYTFDRDTYRQVPQYIYIGDQDTTNSTLWGPGELWRTQSQIDFLNTTFGNTDPVRLENQVAYLNNMGYNNIIFHKYPGIGHQFTSGMINDTFAFFNAHR